MSNGNSAVMTKADWILRVFQQEIERRRPLLNQDETLHRVLVVIDIPNGKGHPGSVQCKFEHMRVVSEGHRNTPRGPVG